MELKQNIQIYRSLLYKKRSLLILKEQCESRVY